MPDVEVGVIEHYFDKLQVGAIEITDGELAVGDTIRIKGNTTDFTTTIHSMQIERQDVEKVQKGDSVGIKLKERVRIHDKVFKVTDQLGNLAL